MIELYSGTPGSGKSLHCADRIIRLNRHRKFVITNFEIDKNSKSLKYPELIEYIDNSKLTPDKLYEISNRFFEDRKRKESQIILFIDEAQLLFNSRDFYTKDRMAWLSFFSQHRKYGFDVVLVAQFDLMIDKQLRSLIEYQYFHRKVSNFGFFGKIVSLLFFGNLFICIKQWYPLNQTLGHEFFSAEKKLYSIYDTFAQFEKAT